MNDISASLALPTLESVPELVRDGSFEVVLEALEAVVAHLEHGRLSLDETVAWYEAGLALARRCSEHLTHAELRISVLNSEYDALSTRNLGRFADEP